MASSFSGVPATWMVIASWPTSSILASKIDASSVICDRASGVAFRVDTPDDVVPTIEKANEVSDRPVVIDFRTDYREKVYPMVPAGHSNDEIILDPAHDPYGER